MIYWHVFAMLADIRTFVEKGTLTAAEQVEYGTVLYCQTNGSYQRIDFDTMAPQMQAQILHKTVGTQVLGVKIVGIFHVWPEERTETKQPIAV